MISNNDNTPAGKVLAETLIEIGKRIYIAEEDFRQSEYRTEQKDREIDQLKVSEKKALENYYSADKRAFELTEKIKELKAGGETAQTKLTCLRLEIEDERKINSAKNNEIKELNEIITDRAATIGAFMREVDTLKKEISDWKDSYNMMVGNWKADGREVARLKRILNAAGINHKRKIKLK